MIIEDKRFGKCVFEKDTKRNSLRLLKGISNMPFDGQAAPQIDINLIKANCEVTNIAVYRSYLGSLIVSLSGGVADDAGRDLLGCHSVKAEINCETGEIEYDLEG